MNIVFVLLCVAIADEGSNIEVEESSIISFVCSVIYKDPSEDLKQIFNDVREISQEQDIVYNDSFLGTLNHLSKTEKKALLLGIKTIAIDIVNADGIVDAGEKLVLEQIDSVFGLKGTFEKFKPAYDSGVYSNKIFVIFIMFHEAGHGVDEKIRNDMIDIIFFHFSRFSVCTYLSVFS